MSPLLYPSFVWVLELEVALLGASSGNPFHFYEPLALAVGVES